MPIGGVHPGVEIVTFIPRRYIYIYIRPVYRHIEIVMCVHLLDQKTLLLKSTQMFPIILRIRSKIFTTVYKVALAHLSKCIFCP